MARQPNNHGPAATPSHPHRRAPIRARSFTPQIFLAALTALGGAACSPAATPPAAAPHAAMAAPHQRTLAAIDAEPDPTDALALAAGVAYEEPKTPSSSALRKLANYAAKLPQAPIRDAARELLTEPPPELR